MKLFIKIIRRTLLSLAIISLLSGVIFIIQHYTVGTKQDLNAFFGFLFIAAIFGIPYLIFFRSSSNKNKNKKKKRKKRTLIYRRCQSCSSSQLSPYKNGYKCEHCGAIYH